MHIIHHRVHSLDTLKSIPDNDGVEIDIRYHNNDLILEHDPFSHHENFTLLLEDFLKYWPKTGTLILNLKSEGIENQCINLLNSHNITNWFFLDMSMPFFVKYAQLAKNNAIHGFSSANLCARFSDFETLDYALSFASMIDWIWVDTFISFPLDLTAYKKIVSKNLKICLVSPELQGQSIDNIEYMKTKISNFKVHAVCTKNPELWR